MAVSVLLLIQLVTFGLVKDGLHQSIADVRITAAIANDFFQIGFLISEQAGAKFSLGSQAQTVAFVAKMMADRADEADFPRRAIKLKDPGWAFHATGCYWLERPKGLQALPDCGGRDIFID